MLVSDMESNRQRWPNVRLGEIGDVSAAFNYGVSDIMMNSLWVYDFNPHEESQNDQISGLLEQGSSEFTVSDPGLSSRFLVDMQQNRENDDPNYMRVLSEYATTNDIDMMKCKVNSGTINQKGIKGPRSKRCRRTVFDGPWNFKALGAFTSTPVDLYGSIDNQGSAMSEGTLGNDANEPTCKIRKGANLESNDLNSESIARCNSVSVNSVGRWLEDVGFGRYAGVFEMHEVDEEALPLLTFDDLKEMGVLAVGPRRKLYAAICRLRARCNG